MFDVCLFHQTVSTTKAGMVPTLPTMVCPAPNVVYLLDKRELKEQRHLGRQNVAGCPGGNVDLYEKVLVL